MQKLIVALALSGAAAFVAPSSAQRASLRVHAEEETAALTTAINACGGNVVKIAEVLELAGL